MTKLTLKDLREADKKLKEVTDGKELVFIKRDGWLLNWRFPFVHRVRDMYLEYI